MVFLLLALLVTQPFVGVAGAEPSEDPVAELAVLGETHGTRDVTHTLVRLASDKGATGCVCPGDFVYGHSSASAAEWKEMMQPLMDPMLPAQGNHDDHWEDWKDLFPDERPYYAVSVAGVQFVSVNADWHSLAEGSKQRVWLERVLAEEEPGALKVVLLHSPWWLPEGAVHPVEEFERKADTSAASMDALMVRHGVDVVVGGHEKNHQHSVRDGVHYVVAGGGGGDRPYAIDYELPGAVYRTLENVVSTLEIRDGSMTLKSYDRHGKRVDAFTVTAGEDSSGEFDAAFRPHGGNAWWVQADVDANAPLAGVEARVDEGAWRSLTLRSWGAWAASLHAPAGSVVEFRATSTQGEVVVSSAYAWPDAAPAPEATFTPRDGNAWWVQTRVDANRDVVGVEARVDGDAWRSLTLRSWGAWAASMHAPAGSVVEFRATLADGAVVESGGFAWPDGTPVFEAAFAPYGGNAWWVQTRVTSEHPIARVEARVDDGAWKALTLRSWGAWAASMHAPEGSEVQFRAWSQDGAVALSDPVAWPAS